MVSLLLTLKSEIIVNPVLFRFMLLIPTGHKSAPESFSLLPLSSRFPHAVFQGDMLLFKHRRRWGRKRGDKLFHYKSVPNEIRL